MAEEKKEEKRRIAYFELSIRYLEEALGFPKDHHIIDVQNSLEDRCGRVIKVLIEGPSLAPCEEGEIVPEVMAAVTMAKGAKRDSVRMVQIQAFIKVRELGEETIHGKKLDKELGELVKKKKR